MMDLSTQNALGLLHREMSTTSIKKKTFVFYIRGRFLEFRRYQNFGKIILKIVGKHFLQRNKQVSVKSIKLKALD